MLSQPLQPKSRTKTYKSAIKTPELPSISTLDTAVLFMAHERMLNQQAGDREAGSDAGGSVTFTDLEYHRTYKETRTYRRRWFILLILCVSMIQNGNNWISFSVCFDETVTVYGWREQSVNLLVAWGPILYLPVAMCLPWLNQRFTFRALITISNLLMCTGALLRCFPPRSIASDELLLVLAHVGQILNGMAAPLVFACPQELSAVWFPVSQRTTATSIAVVSSFGGILLSYLIAYYIVNHHADRLLDVLRWEAVTSLLWFILVLSDQIWNTDIPAIPPSITAMVSIEKHRLVSAPHSTPLKQEMIQVLSNRKLAYFACICGLYQGVLTGWISILDVIFGAQYLNLKESYIALIGIASILAIVFSGVLFGAITDRLKKQFKLFMVVLVLISGLCLVLFTMLLDGSFIHVENEATEKWLAFGLCTLGIFCNAGTYGLSYEAVVELIYPVHESYAGMVLTMYFNFFALVFILLNNYLSALYMNWVVAGVQIVAGVLLCWHQQEYKRLDYDIVNARSVTWGGGPSGNNLSAFMISHSVNTGTTNTNTHERSAKSGKPKKHAILPNAHLKLSFDTT